MIFKEINAKIKTDEGCNQIIKTHARLLYLLAFIQFAAFGILSYFQKGLDISSTMFDVFALILLGYTINKNKSRAISVVLFSYSLVILTITSINAFARFMSVQVSGGGNIFLALLLVVASINLVKATFSYHKIHSIKTNVKNFFIKSAIAFALSLLCFFTAGFCEVYFHMSIKESNLMFGAAFFIPLIIAYSGFFPFGDKLKINEKDKISSIAQLASKTEENQEGLTTQKQHCETTLK